MLEVGYVFSLGHIIFHSMALNLCIAELSLRIYFRNSKGRLYWSMNERGGMQLHLVLGSICVHMFDY